MTERWDLEIWNDVSAPFSWPCCYISHSVENKAIKDNNIRLFFHSGRKESERKSAICIRRFPLFENKVELPQKVSHDSQVENSIEQRVVSANLGLVLKKLFSCYPFL